MSSRMVQFSINKLPIVLAASLFAAWWAGAAATQSIQAGDTASQQEELTLRLVAAPARRAPNAPSASTEPPKPPQPRRSRTVKEPAPVVDAGDASGASDDSNEPESLPRLTPQQELMRDQIRKALAHYYHRPVNARDHSPWEVFHWVIAYNVDAQIYTRGPGGEAANAVAWLCYNHPCHGQRLLTIEQGRPTAKYGVGLEGHPSQFLAILAQSRVMIDYPMMVEGRQFTVEDLVETSKINCNSQKELTFQLIALSHYLDLNDTWKNRTGETWSIPRLIAEEISSPIHGSACGGTHRLMGLSYCVKKREQRGEPMDGHYLRAKVYVDDYIKFTLRMQNADGSFSTEWFAGRGARPDIDRRIQTTGHILEWMVFAAEEERLQDPQILKAVDYLSKTLLGNMTHDWKIGPLGHALRSLWLYDRRVFKPLEEPATAEVAHRESSRRRSASAAPKASDEPTGGGNKPLDTDRPPVNLPASESVDETGPLFVIP
jgi:hypothetical protein